MRKYGDAISMALVAKAISTDYGVTVDVVPGVATAMTGVTSDGGKKIIIPAIEETGEKYLTYLRGYIDHEAGHVRFTDDGVDIKGLGPLERHLWNIFEDCFVERRMSRAFIGCGANLRRLVLEIFDKDDELATDMPGLAVNYCLIRARAVDVPALESRAKACGERLDAAVPGLTERLEDALISGARSESTKESKDHALHVAEILRDAGVDMPSDAMKGNEGDGDAFADAVKKAIAEQVEASEAPEPEQMERYTAGCAGNDGRDRDRLLEELTPNDIYAARKETGVLDARLRSLLQTVALNREGGFRRGRLDCNKLHRLAVNNARVFASRVEKISLNTEIGMVVDMSGSMSGEKAVVTSRSLFAAMSSLRKLPVSVRSFAVGFSGNATVDILDPHEPLRIQMRIVPSGGTSCGEGVVRALMKFVPGSDSRKIIFILTDGRTYNEEYFRLVIQRCAAHGVELYGFGICDDGLRDFMPPSRWRRVNDVKELPAAMFGMLRQAFGV